MSSAGSGRFHAFGDKACSKTLSCYHCTRPDTDAATAAMEAAAAGRFQAQRRAAGGGVRTGRRRVRRMAVAAQAQGRRRWRGARFRADQNRTDEGFCTK